MSSEKWFSMKDLDAKINKELELQQVLLFNKNWDMGCYKVGGLWKGELRVVGGRFRGDYEEPTHFSFYRCAGGVGMIKKFRKKPVVVEALKWEVNFEGLVAMGKFIGIDKFKLNEGDATKLSISTLKGTMTASEGDWIIKGVNGEFYPCKPDIFEKTYEEVK